MFIKQVNINGFLSFNGNDDNPDFEIKFNKKLNVIVGTNGTGKTNFLKILCYALNNRTEYLENYVNNIVNDKYIKIYIEFNDEEIKLLNTLFRFLFFRQLLTNNCINDMLEKLLEIKEILLDIDYFKNGLILSYIYDKGNIIKKLEFNNELCYNDYQKYYMIDINIEIHKTKCIKDNCPIKKIFNMIKLDPQNNNEKHETILNISNIFGFFDNYKIHDEEKNIIDIINISMDNSNLISYKDIKWETHYKFDELLIYYIIDSFNSIMIDDYTDIDTLLKCTIPLNQPIVTSGTINININTKNILYENICMINDEFKYRHKLFKIKNNENEIFNIIQNNFFDITQKVFDLQITNIDTGVIINDYIYVIKVNTEYFECSKGEYELINFLVEYYDKNSHILLLDEPCTRLGSQNKINFRKQILSDQEENTQIIMITHDKELIDEYTCKNIIYFKMKENQTIIKYLNELDNNKIKIICETPEILFSDNCFLVEGYDDFRFYRELLNVFEEEYKSIQNFLIAPMGSCTSDIPNILDSLDISYIVIYDLDNIYKKEDINKDHKHELIIKPCIPKLLEKILSDERMKDIDNIFIDNKSSKNIINIAKDKFKKRNISFKFINDIYEIINEHNEKDDNNINLLDNYDFTQFKPVTNKKLSMILNEENINVSNIDLVINNIYIKSDKKILIVDKELIDLEGIARMIYTNKCDNCGNFNKKTWRNISSNELNKGIKENWNKVDFLIKVKNAIYEDITSENITN